MEEPLEQAVDLNPNGVLVRLDYARALLLDGQSSMAEEILRPIPPGLHPSASVYLAQSLIQQARFAEARDVIERGLALFPDDVRLTEQREVLARQQP